MWQKFTLFAWDPLPPEVLQILEFLSGLEKAINSSIFKVQVSASSAMTGVKWALDPIVVQFLRACLKIKPPRKPAFPAWNLSVVLEHLLLLTLLSLYPYGP